MLEFPKWRYHATKSALIVDDKAAEEALGLGWYDTPAEAAANAEPEDEPAKEDEAEAELHRKELLYKAKTLGLNLHHRSGIDTIQAAIDAHKK